MSKVSPGEVFNFLVKVKDTVSALTLREGSKRFTTKKQQAMIKRQEYRMRKY